MISIENLAEIYGKEFVVARANNDQLREQAYRLRYQVFCVQNSIFKPDDNPFEIERDEYDAIAEHILLYHRSRDDIPVGTARVIMPYLDQERWRPLPMQRVLALKDRQVFERIPARQTAEISRFAISKEFRKHWTHTHRTVGFNRSSTDREKDDFQLIRYVTFGLIRAVLQICMEHKITYLAAFIEPSLGRILCKLGLEFEPVGGLVNHCGIRQPSIARLPDLIEHSRDELTPLWQFVAVREAFSHGPSAVRGGTFAGSTLISGGKGPSDWPDKLHAGKDHRLVA
jgi:N-acyl amino acid synthase of PEP-CTERM/exosortase system